MTADLQVSPTTRLIVILAFAGFASTFAGRSIEPLVGVLARDLQSDPHTVALLSTAFALPYALIQPILGPVGAVVFGGLGAIGVTLLWSRLFPELRRARTFDPPEILETEPTHGEAKP